MKKVIGLSVVMAFVLMGLLLCNLSYAQEKPVLTAQEQALFDQKAIEVQKLAKNARIIAFVKQKNATGETLDEVKEKDKIWIATKGLDEFMKKLLANDCSALLKDFQKKEPVFTEVFVMDKNGALVGATNKTSDYWQGDEDKFIKTYGVGGAGATFIGKIKFDESSGSYASQINVPVVDPDTGNVIGAITGGLDISRLKKLTGVVK